MLDIGKDAFYTLADLYKGFGWSKDCVYRYMREQGLAYHQVGNHRSVKGSDLLEFLDRRRIKERS